MNLETFINHCEVDLRQAIVAIQQPRTDFQLRQFVVGQHDTAPRRWMQCVLELQLKLQQLRRATIEERLLRRQIDRLRERDDPDATDQAALLELDLEAHQLAVVGAVRETEALYLIYQSFPRSYTHAELNAAEAEYWQRRLTRQARTSLAATGRIGAAEQEALRQIGALADEPATPSLELDPCLPPRLSPSPPCSAGPSNPTASSPAISPWPSMPVD